MILREKKNQSSYIRAAKPDLSIPYYQKSIEVLSQKLGKQVQTGEFGAGMQVSLLNDDPITIMMGTKQKDF